MLGSEETNFLPTRKIKYFFSKRSEGFSKDTFLTEYYISLCSTLSWNSSFQTNLYHLSPSVITHRDIVIFHLTQRFISILIPLGKTQQIPRPIDPLNLTKTHVYILTKYTLSFNSKSTPYLHLQEYPQFTHKIFSLTPTKNQQKSRFKTNYIIHIYTNYMILLFIYYIINIFISTQKKNKTL